VIRAFPGRSHQSRISRSPAPVRGWRRSESGSRSRPASTASRWSRRLPTTTTWSSSSS